MGCESLKERRMGRSKSSLVGEAIVLLLSESTVEVAVSLAM